jgi:CrcB protein
VEGMLPYGTLLANTIGCLLIGMILGFVAKTAEVSQTHTLLLATGFCGGFTTFSAFAYENHLLLKSGDYLNFGMYTMASVAIGFIAVFLGLYLVRFI